MQGETRFTLAPGTTLPRIWTGLWQLSSSAWGSAPAQKVRDAMASYTAKGYGAFADHYGPAESLFGQFIKNLPEGERPFGATKWAVFNPMEVSHDTVKTAIDERCMQMQTQCIDLLQFFWQNYQDRSYINALQLLLQLRSEGKIRHLGLCNFDTRRADEVCTVLGPGCIVSNQVQFSIIDVRPLHGMHDICERHGIKVLAYGVLCGGLLTDHWLGKSEPELYAGLNPSQRKYLDVILKAWGTWDLFQALLRVLRGIADRHGNVNIANVAVRWVLEHPFVGAVIIGARLGLADHADDNNRVFTFALTERDKAEIEQIEKQSNSASMIMTIGDCGAEYR
ncbi:Flagellar radial spoke protein 5 [Trametes pubescens]|uniref:Flagellar radial spoke protein 5 n=1 Tax=Trametes pubescens TaxID=154538 RepID=A0A1M2W464_TRAPU|nr:Flagellar radial spoke protein 5 [Trametes pubescens]